MVLDYSLKKQIGPIEIMAMANTECLSCLMGIRLMQKMGFNTDGKLRRTVDYQAFNIHAARETHHTLSPFHQERGVPAG